MFNGMIFPKFQRVPRKVEPMFPGIVTPGEKFGLFCKTIRCKELGTFAERNKKERVANGSNHDSWISLKRAIEATGPA